VLANTRHYYTAAKKLGLPITYREEFAGFSVTLGRRTYFFRSAMTPFNCTVSNYVADNKYCVNRLLYNANLPAPNAIAFDRTTYKGPLNIAPLQFPVVLKPVLTTCHGTDVICNIPDKKTLSFYLDILFKKHQHVMVEEFIQDMTDYRVLLFYGKTIALLKRTPAFVVGDGKLSIKELMAEKNTLRQHINDTTPLELGPLEITPDYEMCFNAQDISINDIPEKGKTVALGQVSNATFGGDFEGLPIQHITKPHQNILKEAALALNLNLVGFDIKARDISSSKTPPTLHIIEANYVPDVVVHEYPMTGIPTPVCETILKRLYKLHPFSTRIRRFMKTT
jgi:D-alanine-D-alanine ligase-like ATP-grasp enzyme